MCFLEELYEVVESRDGERPEGSYVVKLLEDEELLLRKVGEESLELVLAMKDREGVVHEASDLLFHTLVLLRSAGYDLEDVEKELRARHGPG